MAMQLILNKLLFMFDWNVLNEKRNTKFKLTQIPKFQFETFMNEKWNMKKKKLKIQKFKIKKKSRSNLHKIYG